MDVEAICSGWLTKSPSSKYVTLFSRGKLSIRVPVKSKWHRRYFVLHKPQGSLPHQFAFDYFKDEDDHRRRGTINLEECEKILSELDSSHYSHLFSIKTKARDKDRVYYLAAETEEDMIRWVNCLCSLCDLKMGPSATDNISSENHTAAPNPPVRLDSMQLTVDLPAQKTSSNQSLANEELSNEILEEIEAINEGRLEVDTRPVNDRVPTGYTELMECTTGDVQLPESNAEFIELYDVPKSHQLAPPTRIGQSQSVRRPNKPPADGLKASRSANSSPRFARTLPNTRLGTGEQLVPPRPPKPGHTEDLYQNINSNSPAMSTSSEHTSPHLMRINNYTNSNDRLTFPTALSPNGSLHNSPAPDRRTEKAEGQVSPVRTTADGFYHNTAALLGYPNGANTTTTNDSAAAHSRHPDNIYDIPKSLNISANIPPPAQCSGGVIHKYVNASAGIITKSPALSDSPSPKEEDIELERQVVDDNHYDLSPGHAPTRPPKPRILSDPTTLDGETEHDAAHTILQVSKSLRTREYTKDSVFSDSVENLKSNAHKEIQLPSRINTHDSTSSSSSDEEEDEDEAYSVPPAPRPLHRQPVLPARLHNRTLNHNKSADHFMGGDCSYLFSSNVKRSSSMSKVPAPHGSTSKLTMGNASPMLNNHHPILRAERSSTVCATDWRNKPMTAGSIQQAMPKQRVMESVADIQYVELEQSGDRGEPSPKPTRTSLAGTPLPHPIDVLEYTDIDMVKTKALSATRKERDFRKRSENVD